jgi:hypothetical protein
LGGVFFTRSETTTVHLKQEDPNKKAGALVGIDKRMVRRSVPMVKFRLEYGCVDCKNRPA